MSGRRILAVVLALVAPASARAESPVYVLDGGGKSIVRLDAQHGAIEAKAPLPFNDDPTDIVAAPDGKRLVVLSRGKGRESNGTFRPETNASAAIVDASTLSASPRIDLGRGLADVVFTRDEQSVIVLSPGYGEVPGALFRIDLGTAAIAKHVSFDRVVDRFDVAGDDVGVVFQKGGKSTNGRVSFVSLDSLEVIKTVDLSGKAAELVEIPGSGYLYAVEANAVDVISIAERKLAGTVAIGDNARLGGIDQATGSLYVMATDARKNGMLYVLRGAALAGSSSAGSGAPEIFRLTSDGKRAFVGNSRGVTEINLVSPIESRPTAAFFSGFVANSMKTIDSTVTPDGRRVFVLMRQYDKCCTLSIADPTAGSKVATMQVGRTSRRVAQALLAVAATAASYSASRSDARAHGRSSFYYSVYSPVAANNPRGAFAFGPDAKTIYVLDSGTDSITVVDVDSGKRIADLDAPSAVGEVMLLGERTIVATGEKGLTLIDSASNVIAETIDLKGDLNALVVLPNTSTALALSKGDVAIIDGRTTKVTAHIAGLRDPVAAAFVAR